MRAKELAAFIKARDFARETKELRGYVSEREISKRLGKTDPIIARYRFCNVCREDDRVTRFIREWCRKWERNQFQWFAFVVARLFNNPDTLRELEGCIVPFNPTSMKAKLAFRQSAGFKVFNAAYIVSTNGRSMDKCEHVVEHLLKPIWAKRVPLTASFKNATLEQVHELLMAQNGLGSFMAAQIVADMKYEAPYYARDLGLPTAYATDWYTFAAPGPGSKRGLHRVMGTPIDKPYRTELWRRDIELLHKELLRYLPSHLGAKLHMQDLQNCLCEYDKYERARLGEGTPKQIYTPYVEK